MYLILLNYQITYLFIAALFCLALFVIAVWYFTGINKKSKILNKNFILGQWERKGLSPDGEAWSFRYIFENNSVEMKGIPDFYAKANYRIIKEDENLLSLELANIEGNIEHEQAILMVAVDRKGDRLTIDGKSSYKRV